MSNLTSRLTQLIHQPTFQPVKAKVLARRLGVPADEMVDFRRLLQQLAKEGKLQFGRGHVVRPMQPHQGVLGVFRRVGESGAGIVRLKPQPGRAVIEVYIPPHAVSDAAAGDEVLVQIQQAARRGDRATARIVRIVERASRQFVGTYQVRDGEGRVRIDGATFAEPILVGDGGAKNARPDDKVVVELVRYPTPVQPGEGVITEVLGRRGAPGVDMLGVIRAFELPDAFPPEVLDEARSQADRFDEADLQDRADFTHDLVITIDPVDAHDFDDALSLRFDGKKRHWHLAVHIADVAWFVPPGGHLEREARRRGNSVYLPQRVLPMFPEVISNGLASLQEGRRRYTQSVLMEFTEQGELAHADFVRGVIEVRKRFSYDEAAQWLAEPKGRDPGLLELLQQLDAFAGMMHRRRLTRGALELSMPEVELDYDAQGRLRGAGFRERNRAHVLVEECMLTANEAVASHLDRLGATFLRRNHAAPDPLKLDAFLVFAKELGFKVNRENPADRRQLQRLLRDSAAQPVRHAIHYALLRSLRQAEYSPAVDGHYALAARHYTHFTSPIRRFPDLTVHRLIAQWQRTGRVGSDEDELLALGEHCSFTERRAARAEQELIKLRLLSHLSERIGQALEIVITGVEEYGFFGQAETLPVEGLVHVRSLADDFYHYDESTHSLIGNRNQRRFRLGDRVAVVVARVDLDRRLLDFRVIDKPAAVKAESSPAVAAGPGEPRRARTPRGARPESPKRRPRRGKR